MGKLSSLQSIAPAAPKAAIRTRSTSPDTRTYEGGDGYTRKPKSELFLLAVANMVGEDTFYEDATSRDNRYRDLIAKVTAKDPDWIRRFVPFLRNEMNMRSASIVMAVEYVLAGGPNGRSVIDSAIVRADEPAEVIGYARSRKGRSIPQPIKRGVADAVRRLYGEKAALKYDSDSAGYRPADVIDIVHPEPRGKWQSDLFRYLLDKRHNRDGIEIPESLEIIRAHAALMALPVSERRARLSDPAALEAAGLTWEALSGWLQGPMDKDAWSAIIPSMGYMALLRNLRNFEQAGVDGEARQRVIDRLTNSEAIVKSRQFPLRFYSAFKNVESLDFQSALEKAVALTLQNVPVLKGTTLIMVDNSGSMGSGFSRRGTTTLRETAGLFGAALALRSESAELYAYADRYNRHQFTKATPLLKLAQAVGQDRTVGGGTNTIGLLSQLYSGQDRVVIVTDEQTWHPSRYGIYGASQSVNDISVPIYTFNLNGYEAAQLPSGSEKRYTFGGLTDAGFRMIGLIESAEDANWPF